MKVLYNNLYTHFVFTTRDRLLTIEECHRPRIEKYITDIVNNHGCKMYKIYANPEHVHFLVSRDPAISLATQGTLKNQVLVATQVMTIDYHFFPALKKKI